MVKFKQGNLVGLGLTEKNLELLKAGKPIMFNAQDLGLGDIDILIFFGQDEQAIFQELKHKIDPFKTVMTNSRANEN